MAIKQRPVVHQRLRDGPAWELFLNFTFKLVEISLVLQPYKSVGKVPSLPFHRIPVSGMRSGFLATWFCFYVVRATFLGLIAARLLKSSSKVQVHPLLTRVNLWNVVVAKKTLISSVSCYLEFFRTEPAEIGCWCHSECLVAINGDHGGTGLPGWRSPWNAWWHFVPEGPAVLHWMCNDNTAGPRHCGTSWGKWATDILHYLALIKSLWRCLKWLLMSWLICLYQRKKIHKIFEGIYTNRP